MKKISWKSGYAHNIHIVELTDEEMLLPDPVLVSMADGHTKESALDYYNNKGHPGHFGGYVHRWIDGSNKATIKVYTD